ncbi:methyltransferase [Actinomadura opuntiae]|uniref:methyltransferase n=1 Tax=Actinomadura sp. OS1-43 TaxID=604315 RepID=UPI00255AD9F1|nr:methyltransferase [Actinomadura sp. OS1-43]MDL4820263.1 methyltransferase [Actinomadura sp. OS1-43]
MTLPSPAAAAPSRDAQSVARLTEMADYIVPFTLRAVCDLGVADLLADGPRPVRELARETGTDPRALLKALRALAGRGVFSEPEPEAFALTDLGQPLRSDHPRSLRDAYPFIPADIQAWASLPHSLRTGKAAFDHAHGRDYWAYMAEHPDESARFDASQRAVTRREVRTLLPAYPWSRFGTVADVGGGNGAFLAALLDANPGMRGVLFDQPHVVAAAGPVLAAAGVADRCTVVGGSFFASVPSGADAYVLKRALYDIGDDDRALEVLRAVRAAMSPDARLLVIEPLSEPGDAFSWGKLYDLLLLVMRGGGGRSRARLEELMATAGLRLTGVVRTRGLPIVEARPR